MKQTKVIFNIVLTSIFLGLSYMLPFLTGQIPEVGSMLCPMHIPVLLCGFICGWKYGLLIGFIAPMLRSFTLGMPPLFPTALSMSFELATYGFVSGFLYRLLKKDKIRIYISLIVSMLFGRLVWGIVMLSCMGYDLEKFGLTAFWVGGFLNAFPGIILQIILIPAIIIIYEKTFKKNDNVELL